MTVPLGAPEAYKAVRLVRRASPHFQKTRVDLAGMTARGRPSKGDRIVTITTRLPAEVREEVDRIALDHGTSVSQIVADLVSRALGREDLVLDLAQDVLPMTAA